MQDVQSMAENVRWLFLFALSQGNSGTVLDLNLEGIKSDLLKNLSNILGDIRRSQHRDNQQGSEQEGTSAQGNQPAM